MTCTSRRLALLLGLSMPTIAAAYDHPTGQLPRPERSLVGAVSPAQLDPSCGPDKIAGSAAGSSVAGWVLWADNTSAKLAYRLKPDCTGVAVDNAQTQVIWAQADGVVMIDVDDAAATYVGRWSDAGMSGHATRRDGVKGLFKLVRLNL